MDKIKVTKRMRFEEIIEMATSIGNMDIVAFAQHEIALLDKKSTSRGTTTVQKENESIKEIILNELARIGIAVTISELQEQSPSLAGYSNQKLSALLRQLKENGSVVNTKDKKKSFFAIAE